MADQDFEVLIKFITDFTSSEMANKVEKKSLDDLKKNVDDVGKSYNAAQKLLKKFKDELIQLKTQAQQVGKYGVGYDELAKKINLANVGIQYQTKVVNESKEAFKKATLELQKYEKQQVEGEVALHRFSRLAERSSSIIERFSTGLVVGGTAAAGGIFKLAKDFIDNAKEETALTREWKTQTDAIAQSYTRVGAVAAKEVLPFLKDAAAITEKIANFAEQNPGVVAVGLQAGLIALTLGVIGKAVAGGIKLVADVTYIAASTTQLVASAQNLLAAGGMETASGIFATTVGVILLPALVIFAGILSGILVGLLGYEAAARASGGKLQTLEELGTKGGLIVKDLFDKFNEGVNKGSSAVEKFGDNTEKLVDAFTKMNDDLNQEDQKYASDRLKIIQNSNADALRSSQNNATKIKSINDRAAEDRGRLIANFVKESQAGNLKYETDRAQIIRDGSIEIQRIERDRLDKLRQLEQDHNDRVGELAANRDALGLVLEQRKFNRDKAELDAGTNKEIQQRRQDLAIRLNDLAVSFAQERAQKIAQFQQDLKDNEEKRKLELKQQQQQYSDELRVIQQNRVARLKELYLQHREEQDRIRQAFIAQVRDLDAFLLGEQAKKRNAYNATLVELDRFLASYRSRAASIGRGTTGRAGGGYVNNELVQTHGIEFVTSAPTTRILEGLIGSRLSQQGLISAVAGGSSESVTWNDYRRFSGEYTKPMRRAVEQTTLNTMGKALKGFKRR